jgi:hypothetical protein
MRRNGPPLYGAKYCANKNPSNMEVHDLDNEKRQCQINEIILAGHAVPFNTLQEGHNRGFDNCAYCVGASTR